MMAISTTPLGSCAHMCCRVVFIILLATQSIATATAASCTRGTLADADFYPLISRDPNLPTEGEALTQGIAWYYADDKPILSKDSTRWGAWHPEYNPPASHAHYSVRVKSRQHCLDLCNEAKSVYGFTCGHARYTTKASSAPRACYLYKSFEDLSFSGRANACIKKGWSTVWGLPTCPDAVEFPSEKSYIVDGLYLQHYVYDACDVYTTEMANTGTSGGAVTPTEYSLLTDYGFGTSCQFAKGGLTEGAKGDLSKNTLAKCEAFCNSESKCVGYTFIAGLECVKESNKCSTYQSCGADERVKSGCLSGDPVYVTKEKSSADAGYQLVEDNGWGTGCADSGHRIKVTTAASSTECEALCNERSDCRAYTFVDQIYCGGRNTAVNHCALFSTCKTRIKTGCFEPIYVSKVAIPVRDSESTTAVRWISHGPYTQLSVDGSTAETVAPFPINADPRYPGNGAGASPKQGAFVLSEYFSAQSNIDVSIRIGQQSGGGSYGICGAGAVPKSSLEAHSARSDTFGDNTIWMHWSFKHGEKRVGVGLNQMSSDYGQKFGAGSTLTLRLSRGTQELSFWHNDLPLGVAFTGIPAVPLAVCWLSDHRGDKVTINSATCGFGEKLNTESTSSICSSCPPDTYQAAGSHQATTCETQPTCGDGQTISADSKTSKRICSGAIAAAYWASYGPYTQLSADESTAEIAAPFPDNPSSKHPGEGYAASPRQGAYFLTKYFSAQSNIDVSIRIDKLGGGGTIGICGAGAVPESNLEAHTGGSYAFGDNTIWKYSTGGKKSKGQGPNQASTHYGQLLRTGSNVTLRLSRSTQELSFWHNDLPQGSAFTGIPAVPFAVCWSSDHRGDKVTINSATCGFGEKLNTESTMSICSSCPPDTYQDKGAHQATTCNTQPTCGEGQTISADSKTSKRICSGAIATTTTLAPAIPGDACATSRDCTDTQCKNKRCCEADVDRACTSCDDAGFCDSFDKDLLGNTGKDQDAANSNGDAGKECASSAECSSGPCKTRCCKADDFDCIACDSGGFCAEVVSTNSDSSNDADTDGSSSGGGGLDSGTIIGIVVSVVIAAIGGVVMLLKGRKDAENMDMIRNEIRHAQQGTMHKQNPSYEGEEA